MKSRNIDQLATELFVNPNIVFSFIEKESNSYEPLLYFVGKTNDNKLISLFLDSLFHFVGTILNEKLDCISCNSNSKSLFLKKYLNFDSRTDNAMDYDIFVKCIYFVACAFC